MAKKFKTNVMRILDQAKIAYQGQAWADLQPGHAPMYKTLVTYGKSGDNYVFIVPKEAELDLKKAAQAVAEKNIHMLKEKDLLPLTGYVHGGCSPVGMKKLFPTVMDQSALDYQTVLVSAGDIGWSIEVAARDLMTLIDGRFEDIKTDEL